MSRPEIPAEDRRDVYIMVRLTKEEKQFVADAARRVMRNPSDFARVALIEAAKNVNK